MSELKTQNASDELRVLDTAEIDAVSGAATKTIDMGLFGELYLMDNGCAVWSLANHDGNGGWTAISVGQCPHSK